MKKKEYMTVLLLLVSSMLNAQTYMNVKTPDGNITSYEVKPGLEVTWGTKEEKYLHNGYEYVDLGLSVKWATKNIGASETYEYGNYYAWGETSTKSSYSGSAYKWYNGVMFSDQNISVWYCKKYNCNPYYGPVDKKMSLDPEDDVAHKVWGGQWRMPTGKEVDELIEKCSFEWTSLNGVNGAKFTGPNGMSIFLPAEGVKVNSSLVYVGSEGSYWSSTTQDTDEDNNPNGAYPLFFDKSICYKSNYSRHYGIAVRPVCP